MSEPDEDRKVCFCHNVSFEQLRAAIRDRGCRTLDAIKSETCASTGCGGCEYEVSEILAAELEAMAAQPESAAAVSKAKVRP